MATLTRQKPRQQLGTWEESFPKQQVTEIQSSVFVKKLLAVAVSNISYLRVIFPERAFGDRSLEDLSLKILKSDKSCPGAAQMIDWLKGVFDALDKKYLKILIFGIYKNPNDPNTFVEAYTFKFSYVNGTDMEVYSNNKKISSSSTADQTKKATITMLRTLLVLSQTLKPLPDDFQVTMKLFYYDDVTPEDYEPPGFKPADSDYVGFDDNPVKIRVGSIATSFHSMKLRLTTDSAQFKPSDMDEETSDDLHHVALTAMQGLDIEPDDNVQEHEPTAVTDNSGQLQKPAVVENRRAEDSILSQPVRQDQPAADNHQSSQQEVENEFKVCCPCAANEDDGLMIQCCKCSNWQHAVCFKILDESEAPNLHLCNACYEVDHAADGNLSPTDRSLGGLSAAELEMTCLWRRTLTSCLELDELSVNKLTLRLGIKKATATSLMDRLQREGYTKSGGRAKTNRNVKVLDKSKLSTDALKKYFSIDPVTELQKIASQTSSADFHERRQKRNHSAREEIREERKHTQEQQKVCPVANNEYEFDVSNTQDDFEPPQQPRRKRAKSSMAQLHEA